MKTVRVSAPGKLHLLGEHTVVYGKPAILATTNKRCHVEVIPRTDNVIEITSKNLNVTQKFSLKSLLLKREESQKKWDRFCKTNSILLFKSITQNPLDYAAIIIGETFYYYNIKNSSGFTLTINSEVPISAGMGSSASLAVAISAAISLFLNKKFDKEIINSIAHLSERKKHGFPPGGDNSACCFGGLIWYRKETADFKIIQPLPFQLSPSIAKNFVTISTGTPNESSGEMVSMVKKLYEENKIYANNIFDDQEYLVRALLSALQKGKEDDIIQIIKNGEANLEKLGVVSAYTQDIIRKIENSGGCAKICGGGGKTKGTGIVLAFHKDPKILEKLLSKDSFLVSKTAFGDEGVREETE